MTFKTHILAVIAAILLGSIVQAQWNGLGGRGGDDDDEALPAWMSRGQPTPTQNQPRPQQQPQPQSSWVWGGIGGNNGGSPWFGDGNANGGAPWQGGVPWGQPTSTQSMVTVTMTRTAPWGGVTPPPQTQTQQPPRTTTRTWTAPSAWGPPRSPFGPSTSTPTGPQTIPTTTTEMPKEPVPFVTICGYTRYVEDDVSNAIISGCYYKNKTTTVNKSGWPKLFPNDQKFNFGDIKAPYWEYPLINSAAYVGGDPGPDRVIFNTACNLAGELTQNGAGARVYTECKEQY